MKALSFGEVLCDIIEGEEHLGGAPFNLAAHLARCGADVCMLSRLGNDKRGQRVREAMKELGVNAEYVKTDPNRPTGTVDVELGPDGQPTFTIHDNAAWDAVALAEAELAAVCQQSFDVFCFGTLCQRSEPTRTTLYALLERMEPPHVCYDVNLRQQFYSRADAQLSLRYATILKLNREETATLGDLLLGETLDEPAFADEISRRFGLPLILITRGAQGCAVYHDGCFDEFPGQAVEVQDTVGAGDAFTAVFLHRFLANGDPVAAARTANHVGAFVASRRGAIPEYTDEIRAIVEP